jgi:glycerol-3-phosphate dehydrogenase
MFTLPAGRFTIIGTTDTVTGESPDDVRAAPDDIDYLLRSVNDFFPEAGLTPSDVISAWAGIRPLADASFAQNPGGASREHAIVVNPTGLLSITGGKLTTYRAMAEAVVDRMLIALGRDDVPCRTAERPLPGGDIDDPGNEITNVIGALRVSPAARGLTGLDAIAQRLVSDHGGRWRGVWAFAEREPSLATQPIAGQSILAAELVYAVVHEMALTLGDLLIRGTRVAFETPDRGRAAAAAVADLIGPRLHWTDAERAARIAAYRDETDRMFGAPVTGES